MQAAPIAGHHHHSHLRRYLRRGFLGSRGDVRQEQGGLVSHFLDLPHGIPSHDTFGDVFSRLAPDRFQECFMEWSRSVADLLPGEVVAIDGKTVRRSHDNRAGKQAIHLVSAWASANTLTLGQVKTEEKSNEITAIPRLLELLDLRGCIVTIDAMAARRRSLKGLWTGRPDYLLAVKENQGRLCQDTRDLFEGAEKWGFDGVPTTMPPL